MKTRIAALSALLCVAALAAATADIAPAPGRNLVEGGTLEGVTPGGPLPKSWYRFGKPTDASRAEVRDGGRNDDAALRIEGHGEYAGVATNSVPIDLHKQYATRAWVKVEDPAGCPVFEKLDLFDANHKYITSLSGTATTVKGSGWQLLSRVNWVHDHPNAAFAAVAVGVQGKGTAWFDDLELVETGASPENLLHDGGMEAVQGKTLANWHLAQDPAGTVQLLRRTVPVHSGWYSLELKGHAQWSAADGESVPFEKGYRYVLTGWARARSGRGQIRFGYFKNGQYLGSTNSKDATTNEWRQFTVEAEPDRFPDADRIYASGLANGKDIDVFFDDFTLTRQKR